jgi:cobalt-precorrin-5B (C1)-methyltransferase
MAQYPAWPELAFVQAADFVAFSLEQAVEKGFSTIAWGCFFGKLVKLAQGHAYTHAHTAPIDFTQLAEWCRMDGAAPDTERQIAEANTARQVLEIIETKYVLAKTVLSIAHRAHERALEWTGGSVQISIQVFDFDGRLLAVV